MNALSIEELSQIVLNHSFLENTCDLFSGRRAGHMSKWLYSSPLYAGDQACGSDMWRKVVREAKLGSPYYVFNEEQNVISENAQTIASYLNKSASLIDLGPGSEDALINKIMPILNAANGKITQYIGVDVNPETIDIARKVLTNRYSDLKFSGMTNDFIMDPDPYKVDSEIAMVAIFGLTLFNMTIDPRVTGLPHLLLNTYLTRIRAHFGKKEGYLLITQDINQDKESLTSAYFAIGDYFLPLLHRISRDLPIHGDFDPNAFKLDIDFFEETKALSICFVAQKDMNFSINDEPFLLKEGTRYYFHNAYKFDTKTFLNAAHLCGFQCLESISEKNKRSVLHILKTV